MMKPTGLLTACGVLVVLGGLVFWFQKHPTKPADTTTAAPKILSLGADQIESIRLAKPGADPIELKKQSDKWVITQPTPLAADQDAAKAVADGLASLNADRLIDEKPSDLAAFGLVSPPEEVDVTVKGGSVNKVLIGSDTPSGSDTYVKLASNPKVYTILTATKNNIDKSVNDLRDKRLLTFNQDKLTSVSVTSKGPLFEFAKNGQNEWQISKPRPYRADSTQVDDLIRKLKDAKMDMAAYDQKKASSDFAAAEKVGTAAVTDNSGTQTLEVRQAKDKTYWAKPSITPGVYKLTGDLGDGLKDKEVSTFRNRKLFDFGFTDPSKVEINGATYVKDTGKDTTKDAGGTETRWTGPSGRIDSSSIQNVIDKLRDLSASRFSEKMSGAQTLQFAITSGANNKIEKVTINKDGDTYNAQRGDDPSVYVVEASSVNDLQSAVKGIRPWQAPKSAAKK